MVFSPVPPPKMPRPIELQKNGLDAAVREYRRTIGASHGIAVECILTTYFQAIRENK